MEVLGSHTAEAGRILSITLLACEMYNSTIDLLFEHSLGFECKLTFSSWVIISKMGNRELIFMRSLELVCETNNYNMVQHVINEGREVQDVYWV